MADHGASSSSSYFKYDVFLSFRGDTRHAFTDHLYRALTSKGIKTFRDDEKLRGGEDVRRALPEAIERSRMSIVVLCENYASSSWCLNELVEIIQCSIKGRPAIPVFYRVEPMDVRYQINAYGTAMAKHETRYRKDPTKLATWRKALFEVSMLKGQHCKIDRYEGNDIDKIIAEVLLYLPPESLHIKHPVGFDSQFEVLKSLLDIESCGTPIMLGIYGDDKTDKTIFAVELYNKIRDKFEGASFLENVGEKSKESTNGLESLQETLLSEMGKEAKTMIGSTFKGSSEIKRRLGHKRVLLVLDDVDSIQQLDSLAGRSDWFGPGSRIIVTTRYEHVLDKHVLNGVEIKKYCIASQQVEEDDVEQGDVVGFTNNFSVVMDKLKENDSCNNVVCIIGMGGLGKTTLAQKIYDNNEVKKLFPCRAWSRVSKDYRAMEVLLSLLHSLTSSSTSIYRNSTEGDLKKKVRDYLKGNKYFIVLDDIWDPKDWEDVKGAFPNDQNGSRILITSRNESVAHCASTRQPYFLPLLNEEECWKLFCQKVFFGEECPSNLVSVGRSIVESCGRLPLAIITLAGVVSKKPRTEREWLRIKSKPRWHLTQDKTNKVMDVLRLSYESLREELKPCFLYFGIYPEYYEIYARELIQVWIAEGFIPLKESGTPDAPEPEDIGEEYLEELVDLNLVQVVKRRSDSGVKKCLIHDLLREFCILESRARNNFVVCSESNMNNLGNPPRLSLQCSEKSFISSIKCEQPSIRSLFIFAKESYADDSLENFESIQVLHFLKGTRFPKLPLNLEAMVCLRYLRVQGSYLSINGTSLFSEWSQWNLETLDVKVWRVKYIHSNFWKLQRLRHFYLRSIAELPEDDGKANSKTMWNLQSLCGVYFNTRAAFLFSSDCFRSLRKLYLCYNFTVEIWRSLNKLLYSLHHLSNLCTLKLSCNYSDLSLDAAMFPSNLTKMTLLKFRYLDLQSVRTLGRLPNLQTLKLITGFIISNTLRCAIGEFPHLQVFHMWSVKIQRWTLEEGAMPRLRRLLVCDCGCLSELPQQLWSLATLEEVQVVDPSDELRKSLQDIEVNDNCDLKILNQFEDD